MEYQADMASLTRAPRVGMAAKCLRVAIATVTTVVGRHGMRVCMRRTATRSRLLGAGSLRHGVASIGYAVTNLVKPRDVVGVIGCLYDYRLETVSAE